MSVLAFKGSLNVRLSLALSSEQSVQLPSLVPGLWLLYQSTTAPPPIMTDQPPPSENELWDHNMFGFPTPDLGMPDITCWRRNSTPYLGVPSAGPASKLV